MTAEVLIVEDDAVIRDAVRLALRSGGLDAVAVDTAAGALREARMRPPRLVLLDLGLPDADGFATCADLRRITPEAVIVVLTARQAELDVVAALESGADDFLTKPFKLIELLARVRAHLRRPGGRVRGDHDDASVVVVGDLVVDRRARTAAVAGEVLRLGNREYDLLDRLARDAGRAVSRAALIEDVWDAAWTGSTKTLDVHVLGLRRKLVDAARSTGASATPSITTLRGHGYRLDTVP